MERIVYEDEKIVEFWVTNAESKDAALQQHLRNESQKWKQKKFKTVVFYSGNKDLLAVTKPLISYNIELAIKQEKEAEVKKGA